jgi:hypothetical protein
LLHRLQSNLRRRFYVTYLLAFSVIAAAADQPSRAIAMTIGCDLISCVDELDAASLRSAAVGWQNQVDACREEAATAKDRGALTVSPAACFGILPALNSSGSYLDYKWLFPRSIFRGPETLEELLSSAANERPLYQLAGSSGLLAVFAEDPSIAGRQIAVCEARIVADRIGIPKDCNIVAILGPEQNLLRAIPESPPPVPSNVPAAPAPLPAFSASVAPARISAPSSSPTLSSLPPALRGPKPAGETSHSGGSIYRFTIKTKIPAERFYSAILKMSRDFGLKVETEVVTHGDGEIFNGKIFGVSGIRNSAVLGGGWREMLNLDTAVDGDEISVRVGSTSVPLVSRQNLSNNDQFRGANDLQRSTYAAAIDSKLLAAIRSVCSKFIQNDDFNVECN